MMSNTPVDQDSSAATAATRVVLVRAIRYVSRKLEGYSRSKKGFLEEYDIKVMVTKAANSAR